MSASGFEGLLTGHTLADRYHVDEVIGRGGFAAVYSATDQRLGRTVAVKVITQSASNPEMRSEIQRRFEREARAIAMLHHPNVVTVFDFGADPALGLDFLVMEMLRGEVLSDRLKRAEPIPVPEALRILRDAARGVDAGHRAGLIHRDIKPGNIFLAQPDHGGSVPRVVVVDFGIARFTEQETTQLTHSGRGFLSPAYASPEQLRGERPVTPASDVFSLGVIGYHLLAREKPFTHDRLHPGPTARPLAPLGERNPAVPAAVAAVIERAMREDPAERFADAGEFVRALEDAEAAAEEQGSAPVAPAVVLSPEPTQLQPPLDAAIRASDPGAPDVRDASVDAAADAVEPAARAETEADFAPPPIYAAIAPVAAVTAEPAAPHPAAAPGDQSAEPPVAPRSPASVDGVRRDEPPGVSVRGPAAARPARRMSPALLAIPLLLAVAIALWLLMGRGGKGDRVAAGTSTTTEPETAPSTAPDGSNPGTPGVATAGEPGPGTGTGQAGTSVSTAGAGATPGPAAANPAASGSPSTAPAAGRPPAAGGIVPAPAVATRPPAAAPSSAPASVPVAASASGGNATALNRQGEALFERGEMESAIGRFRAAVRAAPGNAYYRNNLGWALFQAGRIDEAGRELNQAVRLDPRRDIAYANIGEVERARGNIPAAIAAYERFLELNTDPRREAIAREKLRALRGG
ncbi:MAG TPA: serine/threonine-protein kinase [Longimicrobium sp.]|nr:serine/threonine-protein kinase [Longimicrobium sp.]